MRQEPVPAPLERDYSSLPAVAAVLSAALLSLVFLRQYAVDVPYMDEWDFVPPLWKALNGGTLDLEILLRQHNEHRLLIVALLYVALLVTIGWNEIAAMIVTQGCLLAGAIGCAILARQTVSPRLSRYLLPLVAVLALLYTPAQAETLLWGFTMQLVLPSVCVMACVLLARSRLPLLQTLVVSALLASVATFSLLNGSVCWAVMPPIIWWTHREESRERPWMWLLWLAALAVVGWTFVDGYHTTRPHGLIEGAFANPWLTIRAPFALLGRPLAFGATVEERMYWAELVGFTAAGFALLPLAYLVRNRRDEGLIDRVAPWLSLGGYGLASVLLVAVGRSAYGMLGLSASRYVSLSVWILIAVVMVTAICLAHDRESRQGRLHPWSSHAALACWVVGAMLYGLAFGDGLLEAREMRTLRLQGKAALEFSTVALPVDHLLHPNWDRDVRDQAAALRDAGLLPLQGARTRWMLRDAEASRCAFGAVTRARRAEDGGLDLAGWAWLPRERRAPDGVVMTERDPREPYPTPVRFVVPAAERSRSAARQGVAEARPKTRPKTRAGWHARFSSGLSPRAVQAWAIDAAAGRAYPLCGVGR
ncbi:MAG: hypothetical protein GEV06_04170 [Luteitalea sp.]|nr:hypothetical protein [Luteitalea sp.]